MLLKNNNQVKNNSTPRIVAPAENIGATAIIDKTAYVHGLDIFDECNKKKSRII
jgi:hypothetical protein